MCGFSEALFLELAWLSVPGVRQLWWEALSGRQGWGSRFSPTEPQWTSWAVSGECFPTASHTTTCAHKLKHMLKWWLGPQVPSHVILMQEQPETGNQDNREKGKQMQVTDQNRKLWGKLLSEYLLLHFKLAQKLPLYYHQMLHGMSLYLMSFVLRSSKFGSWIHIDGSPWREQTFALDPRVTDAISVSHNSHKVCHKQS